MIIHQLHELAQARGKNVGYYFEAIVEEIYRSLLGPGDTAMDVGAHAGRHLFPMAEEVGARGRIIAFEPISTLHHTLEQELADRSLNQVRLFKEAAAADKGVASFCLFESHPAYSGLKRRHTHFSDQEGGLVEVPVDTCRIDSKAPWFRRIKVIKLDIEGGEFHALLGADRIMRRSRPVILFENGLSTSAKLYGYSKDDFFGLFESRGYQVFRLDGEPITDHHWHGEAGCWEFVALPKERGHEARTLEGHCRTVLAREKAVA